MKNLILFTTLFTLLMTGDVFAQTQTAQFYNVKSGQHGNGIRFWNSDLYKIHMGNLDEYHYGPVSNYSIKFNMNNAATRGWTWGVAGETPIAALNTQGNLQVEGWIKNMSGSYYFGDKHRLYVEEDLNTSLHYRSGHSKVSAIILRDKEGTKYGQLYGYNGRSFGLLDGDGNWSYRARKDEYTTFHIDDDEKMRITSDGNVGIGTDTPEAKLAVHSSGFRAGIVSINEDYGDTYLPNSNGWSIISGHNVIFRANGEARMRVADNGNIGIGPAALSFPIYDLDVDGTIRAKVILVENAWGDYVFNEDYKLPTLEEEEKHIEAKGHLIGFESEEDMEGKIPLGDVTKRQQVKIEEMMLHLIELSKQNERLQAEITTLKAQINKK